MTGNVNSQWGLAKRNQQRGNPERSQQPRQQRTQQRKTNDYGGFDGSILGMNCKFKLANGETLQGLVAATSKYWYLVNVDGQVIIVNKAYVVSIMPVQSQNNKQSAGTLVGVSVGAGGNHGGKKQ
jgi:sRNA-binding regulator protein Hfq